MRLEEINKPEEHYIFNESVSNFYEELFREVRGILKMVENQRPEKDVEKAINEFMDQYKFYFLSMRTLLNYDQIASKDDSNRPSLIGISRLVNAGKIEEVKSQLESLYANVIKKIPVLTQTFETFKKALEKDSMKKTRDGYVGVAAIRSILALLEDDIGDLVKNVEDRHKKDGSHKTDKAAKELEDLEDFSLSEMVSEMIEAGYGSELFEAKDEKKSKKKEDDKKKMDEFFMLVDMKLYDDKVNSKTPIKNFKNTLVTKAGNQTEARKKLKSQAQKSLKELNKYLKDKSKKEERGLKADFGRKDWSDHHTLYKGRDRVKKKNIKGLTGTNFVSTGVMFLKGLDKSGNVSDHPECCPNKYAMVDSNASLSRYINKNFGKD